MAAFKKLTGLLWSLLLLTTLSVQAQTREISGRITDQKDGLPLAGVTVTVKGTSVSTATGADGTFSLKIPSGAKTLVISSVGYAQQEVAVYDNISVSLTVGESALSEVVVVGYGTKIKRDITGSVAKVGAKELGNTPATSFESALQGRAAGVQVEQQNGKLGQGIKVRIRGASSVSAGNEPLYVVDGVPVTTTDLSSNGAQTSPLADLNTNDIESIEVLKDASSAAIYGSQASNGVVLITTKRGKAGKSKIDFGFFSGVQEPTHLRSFMNAQQFVDYSRQAAVGAGKYEYRLGYWNTEQEGIDWWTNYVESRLKRYSAGNDDYKTYKVNTDWQKEAFQPAPITQYDLSLSGGNEKTTFYMAGQYLDQTGIAKNNSLKRYNGRLNIDHKLNNWLSAGMNMAFSRTLNFRVSNDNAFSTPLQSVALSPITPLIDPRTGLISGELDPETGVPNTNYPVYYNPMLSVKGAYYNTFVNRILGNVYGQAQIMKGLSFRTEFGMDQLNQTEEAYYGPITVRNTQYPRGGGFTSADQILNYNTNNFFRYFTKIKEDHDIDVVAGMSYQDQNHFSQGATAESFPSSAYKKLTSAGTKTDATSTETEFSFLSYFSRLNYKFKNRYLLALSGRYDASSRFGPNSRWGFFPAASAGWILSEEKFLADSKWLSFLKVKASYGLTGNAGIGNYPWQGLWTGDGAYASIPGQRPSQLSNPDLKWETTASADFGVEFGIIKNRVTAEVDYYFRDTKDLLLAVEVPGTSGFSSQIRNLGKLNNKGFEFSINSENIVTKNFRWTTNLNFAMNKNTITDLKGQELGIGNVNRAREGQPLGVFVAREFAGADPATGDAIWYKNTKDASGKIDRTPTSDYNEAADVVIGNPNPDFIYGMRNNFNYKGLELDVFIQGVHGNKIYDGGGQYMSASGSNGFDNQTTDQLNAWKNPGDKTMVPEARTFQANGTDPSSRWLYDGSYLRIKQLTLGYNLPKNVLAKIKLERAKVYVRGQNLFTFTNYKGWDPEVNADYQASNINQGVDFYSVPQLRTIIFGVSIGL
ncbi:SusC/RagA family TonB-linked outer membrane protein [Flavihumibacter profundi]|uniref:SusC/RagA family TonB-linked outer membrane protein n=1 Tax=Flavihumibacter profundi TaxID=2716883 RepID=UPI001CC41D81|nr:TonB-dependent receptor [Flavihumibacter profundi]MBZ5858656.1 TonB-dependent receptor [Flavihumibacter profundi]